MPKYCHQVDEEVEKGDSELIHNSRLLVLALVIVFILSLTSIVITVFVTLPSSQSVSDKSFRFCLPCLELAPSNQTKHGEDKVESLVSSLERYTNNLKIEMCCTLRSSQAKAMLNVQSEIRMTRLQHSTVNRKLFDFSSISAHKYLMSPGVDVGNRTLRINTDVNDSPYEHVKDVDLTPTGLKVKYEGLYYLYKSVYYVPDSDHPCKVFSTQIFTSILQKKNKEGTQNLLTSANTCCSACIQNRESSFTGGIYQLRSGDEIQVQADTNGHIYFNKDVTFIGLMMIQGQGQ